MAGATEVLLEQYQSSISENLILAILSLYNITNQDQLELAKDILSSLSEPVSRMTGPGQTKRAKMRAKEAEAAAAKALKASKQPVTKGSEKKQVPPPNVRAVPPALQSSSSKLMPPSEGPARRKFKTSYQVEEGAGPAVEVTRGLANLVDTSVPPMVINPPYPPPYKFLDHPTHDLLLDNEQASKRPEYDLSNVLPRSIDDLLLEEDVAYLGTPDKEVRQNAELMEMFPTILYDKIQEKMQEYDGDHEKVVEYLLNLCFLESEQEDEDEPAQPAQPVTKGIDGFANENNQGSSKKRFKTRSKQVQAKVDISKGAKSSGPSSPQPNAWQRSDPFINFLVERTNFKAAKLLSVFHSVSGSFPKALMKILEEEIASEPARTDKDGSFTQSVSLLTLADPEFPERLIATLLRMTMNSEISAFEVMKKYKETVEQETSRESARLQPPLLPQYKAVNPSSSTASEASTATKPPTGSLPAHEALRHRALAAASAAHRKASSSNNMGAVAGYYSAEARDFSAQVFALRAADADKLAQSQSTPSSVDLHGIDVRNGVRIASERVGAWWARVKERVSEPVRGQGKTVIRERFEVITGKGTHSAGGVGKLGPAVFKTLVAEEWKIEVGDGVMWVFGKK
ncbi:MAG: hypothetical protein M1814_003964 [Vezdaea aestivalis]|nr:MAG: hypothetical protein M1814_003964 [Vezdaea aestivalis]